MAHPRSRLPRTDQGFPVAALVCVAGLLLAPVAGCGARTGLLLPDASVEEEEVIEVPCVEIPLDGSGAIVDLSTDAELARADVFLLLDNTSSMKQEHDEIQARLRNTIAPAVFATIPDTEFGVGVFSDFPVDLYGDSGDRPFELLLTMSDNLLDVQAALRNVVLRSGDDNAESQVEALYQVATGDGLGSFVGPSLGCPTGGFGAPCFRDDAQPVVLLFTDAPMHNGPGGSGASDYQNISPPPHTYREARAELLDRRIRVIGLWSGRGSSGRSDLEIVAADTGATDTEGRPIVFDIGTDGEHLGTGVVSALSNLAEAAVFDVDVVANDPNPGDGVDVRAFVESIVPVRAAPMEAIQGIDVPGGRFLGVRAGTTVVYEVTLRGEALVPAGEPRVYRLELVFRGDGVTFLGVRQVDLVIPSVTGEGCAERAGVPRQ